MGSDFELLEENNAIEETETKDDSIRCTKDDAFKISVCKCPDCVKEREEKVKENGIEVNDTHIKGWVTFRAIAFMCPKCGEESVLVAPNMGEYCLNSKCRAKVDIKSEALTAYINRIS
jgi:hypothetical protein